MFLSQTAEFDKYAYDSIINLTEKYGLYENVNTYIEKKLHKNIIDSFNEKEETYVCSENKFNYCMDSSVCIPYLDAANQIRLLNHILKLLKSKGHNNNENLDDFYEKYLDDIINYRNAFAHVKCEEGKIVIKGNSIVINESLHKKMRENLSKYRVLLNQIMNL